MTNYASMANCMNLYRTRRPTTHTWAKEQCLWYSIQNVKSRFQTVDKKNDILIFVEIKTVEFDHLDLPDEYTFFAKHRKKG